MLKTLVLVGFVAAALAEPAPQALFGAAATEEFPLAVQQARLSFRECSNRCGAPWTSAFRPCMDKCIPEGQNPIASLPNSFKECAKKCGSPLSSSFRPCLDACSKSGRNLDDSLENVRESRDLRECEKKCSPFLLSVPVMYKLYNMCVSKCQRVRKIQVTLETLPDVAVRQARDVQQCIKRCSYLVVSVFDAISEYTACVDRCKAQGRSLEDMLENPINSGIWNQSTDPISVILSQVVQRQEEMLQMINSCGCANNPFGQDNSAQGPYF